MVSSGTREPNDVASGVHDEFEGLRRGPEAERDGVGSIAVGGEGSGGGGRGTLGIFEVVGSGFGLNC